MEIKNSEIRELLLKDHEVLRSELAKLEASLERAPTGTDTRRQLQDQLDRLLDPDNPNVLLETVQKAACAVGKRITIRLEDARQPGT